MSDELSQRLNYKFKNPDYLTMALTHRSVGSENNERLEFLGDAVVNFIIAELLYQAEPEASEGELSRYRATYVNRDTLANLALEFNLGSEILLGQGELRSGGQSRHSILSCAMEAVIGAIYLDGGFEAVRACIKEWYHDQLSSIADVASHKDPKTLLQEYLQSKRLPLPVYKVEIIEGRAHQQQFTMRCQVDGLETSTLGKGTSRRRAEQEAARAMLEALKHDN